jgi:hypothetical protein
VRCTDGAVRDGKVEESLRERNTIYIYLLVRLEGEKGVHMCLDFNRSIFYSNYKALEDMKMTCTCK